MPRHLRRLVTALAAAAILSACAGQQTLIRPLDEIPQTAAVARYRTLYSFGVGSDGQDPKAALTDVYGTLYGTTFAGGEQGNGTIFTITTTGTEKVLYSFKAGHDGGNPSASLIEVKGLLYGTTENYGGGYAEGTVFSVNTSGILKTLHAFKGHYFNDGAKPVASLIDVKGKLYGTTSSGGGSQYGTVFKTSTGGREKVLHSFGFYYPDGGVPAANLTEVNGTLYGTTVYGDQISSAGYGTIFSVSTTGTEKVLVSFSGSQGAYPEAGLIDVSGTLYGTTASMGASGSGAVFSVTTNGYLTDLHNFSGPDGSGPFAPLLDVKGTLYGTTGGGGAYGKGTLFRMSLTGEERVLHSFGRDSDGATPLAGLIDVNGTLYGTTSAGGANGNGTVFAYRLRH